MASNYSSNWNIKAFEGLYYDPHQAAYRFCSLIIYIMFLIKAKKSNNVINTLLLIICEVLLLKTGARTPTAMGLALGMIAIYFMKDSIVKVFNKNRKLCIALSAIAVITILVYLPKTAFIQKNIVAAEGTFDNGRTVLRNAGVKYFINSNTINKIIGNDINEIYKINFEVIHNHIWSHSDIMQILLQFGIIMLVIYIETVVEAMLFHIDKQKKFDKFVIILLYLTFLFVAFYNGLFYHPRFVVTIPIIFMLYKLYNEGKEEINLQGE